MTAKEYLMQVMRADRMIDNKLHEIQELRRMSVSITSALKDAGECGGGSGGGSSDKVGVMVSKIIDMENELDREIDKLVDLKREVMSVIDQLETTKCEILYKRYLQNKTWEKIAVETGYSYVWVCKLHGRALQDVERILNGNCEKDS